MVKITCTKTDNRRVRHYQVELYDDGNSIDSVRVIKTLRRGTWVDFESGLMACAPKLIGANQRTKVELVVAH